jgi:hydroxypyruvate isomerase
MLKFSPCMDIFFNDLPFGERIDKIARLGYKNYEFWVWWEKNLDEVKEATERNNMNLMGFCTHFVSLIDASKRNEYLDGLGKTIEACQKTGAGMIISQVGDELKGIPREVQQQSLIDGLKEAAIMLEGTGLILVFEPLNILYDHKGYYLSRSDEAYHIAKEVGSPHIKILFDIYHQQITEGNVINNIRDYFDEIAHMHMADNPGRHEVGTGEINYPNVLKAIEDLNFQGGVGIELFPLNENHEEVLGDPLFFG